MESSARPEGADVAEAEEFVRFCYRRRRVGWPDLYDEMCRVAHRGLYQGMGLPDLAEIGIGFSLFDTSQLQAVVARVVIEERAARARLTSPVLVIRPAGAERQEPEPERAAVPVAVASGA